MGELNIRDQINEYYYRYLDEIIYEDLFNTHEEIKSFLNKVTESRIIDDANFRNADALKMRIAVKANLLKYLNTKFDQKVYVKSKHILNEFIIYSKDNKYNNMIIYLDNQLNFIVKINEIFSDYSFFSNKIIDHYGNINSKDINECNEVIIYCKNIIDKINEINDFNPFNDGANFINIKDKLYLTITELAAKASEIKNIIENDIVNDFIKKNLEIASDSYLGYNFAHIIDDEYLTNFMILSTPINIEAILSAYLLSTKNKKTLAIIDAKKIDFTIEKLINSVRIKDFDLLLYNIQALYHRKDDIIFEELIKYSKSSHNVYIVNTVGDKEFYNRCTALANDSPFFKKENISQTYIPLPTYTDIIDLLVEKQIISRDDSMILENIRTNLAFMGYAGLNDVIKSYVEGRNWFSIGTIRSHENYNADFIKYYKNIPSKNYIISEDWKDVIDLGIPKNITKYDYDKIKDISDEKIKYILDLDVDIWIKSGVIVKYALLGADDISSWELLADEEIKERVTKATYLLYIALEIDYRPEVIIEYEIGEDTWGGICCESGKLVKYKFKYLKDCTYAFHVICHECRHAFQYYVIQHEYDEKYLERFITKSMREEWSKNFKIYDSKNKLYSAQVVEADANAFAADCKESCDAYWHLLNI